jgi:hypothetical protein
MSRERTVVDCKVVHIERGNDLTIFDIALELGEFKDWHFVGGINVEPIRGYKNGKYGRYYTLVKYAEEVIA